MPNDIKTLCEAAGRGDLTAVTELLDREPSLIRQRHEGATPLHFAALEGQNAVAQLLLDRGADPNVRDEEFGSPPAGWANEKGYDSTVKLLASRGTRVSARQAAAWDLPDRLEALLAADPEALDRVDGFGAPLHEAVIWGRTSIVEQLLARGADRSRRSRDGSTALEFAIAQARNGRAHASIVIEERRKEIERECARIAAILSHGEAVPS